MLYLPPHWAHDGIAIGECTTYSIGFKSPDAQALGYEFLGWLQERLKLEGLYADPDLALQENSALIGDAMIDQVQAMLSRITWTRDDVADFLGSSLTEPKPHLYFDPPEDPLSQRRFISAAEKHGVVLDPRTLLLLTDAAFYMNGERIDVPEEARAAVAALAHHRQQLPGDKIDAAFGEWLYQAYCDGFLHLDRE